MKNRNLFLGLAMIIVFGFSSCNDEKELRAKKVVESYITYVDSVEKVSVEDPEANWVEIEAEYLVKVSDVEIVLDELEDKSQFEAKIIRAKAKYESMKDRMEIKEELAMTSVSPKQKMRNALFGKGKIGDDMKFNWVNKDNILSVYEQFVRTVESNKDSYSREDWDEIKMMYEALDSRKNTVEKEGLSSEDNRKIAALKLKFAPMYRLNRILAKSAEMEKAKE
ncbi:DUF6565 domain-containing protein [Flavobacterium sp. GCM10023249]|uniref:DUF6565 domain-containing protein n=1 Tax=unclassified Flavobacterium TaxID=196869 RepID=UPI0036176E9A